MTEHQKSQRNETDAELTQAQSLGEQATAKRLSLQATMPPAEVPGVRVERFLGAGAFGQVWVGKDLNTGRGVAVKFYLHRGGVNWSLLSREVKNLVQLSADRHVVQVLEVGWDADPPYYVMELIEGGSLEQMLLRRGRLPVSEAVDLFQKICIGLNHCHSKGVLHCDIKPANILLGADNEPRLADFGQSRMSHDQTPAMGTLFYMAPEQADLNSTPDSRWDVYAAGALLYRMLAGNAPHRDQSLLSQLDTAGSLPGRLARYRDAIADAPNAVDRLPRGSVDRSLRRILEKCLRVDPKQRYANVQQILDDLHRREAARAKRPLLLLGIVGPILLLLATCVFAYRSINRATHSATSALRTEAFGSNQLAARFAALTLETEIERYFHLAQDEASRERLLQMLEQTLRNEEIATALSKISQSESAQAALSQTQARDVLLDSPVRQELDEYLEKRLALYSGESGTQWRRQKLATMFVCDDRGTILSIAYGRPVAREQNSAGRNFAYRTYFNGLRDDLRESMPLDQIDLLTETHMSAAFQSTATGLWKVAISTPIHFKSTPAVEKDEEEINALFVMTIDLGDFQLLQSSRGASQVAVLVEAREGPLRGTVLQHPLMDQQQANGRPLSTQRFQVNDESFDRLLDGGDIDYSDPMAAAADGDLYTGKWIAAMQPVTLPQSHSHVSKRDSDESLEDDPSPTPDQRGVPASSNLPGTRRTDLLVLVQYRLSDVLGPVGQLRSSLFREGLFSIASILVVTFLLWWMVWRVTNEERLGDGNPTSDSEQSPDAAETMTVA